MRSINSPLVEGAEMGCAYIGVDSLQLIYPDDDAIINAVREAMPEGFTPQIGLAGNKFLAYLVARRSLPGGYRGLNGDVADSLRNLHCNVLPVSARSQKSYGVQQQLSAISLFILTIYTRNIPRLW